MHWSIQLTSPMEIELLKISPPGPKLCSNALTKFIFFQKGKLNDLDFLLIYRPLKLQALQTFTYVTLQKELTFPVQIPHPSHVRFKFPISQGRTTVKYPWVTRGRGMLKLRIDLCSFSIDALFLCLAFASLHVLPF